MTPVPRRGILAPLEREAGRVKRAWTTVLLTLVLCGSSSASTEPDELQVQLESARGTERVRLLNELSTQLRPNEPRESIARAEEAEELAAEISDRAGRARALNNIGIGYYLLAEYGRALGFYERSLAVVEELGEPEPIANVLNNIGLSYIGLERFDEALAWLE